MINILHILKSTKRDKNIVSLYDSIEGINNSYLFDRNLVHQKNSENDYHFLKQKENVSFYDNSKDIILTNISFDYIFVYALSAHQIRLCEKYKSSNTKIVWVSLGGELYSNLFMNVNDIYQKETLVALKSLNLLRSTFREVFYKIIKTNSSANRFLKNVDFVSPRLENEMEIIKKNKKIAAPYIRLPLGDNIERSQEKINKIDSAASEVYVGPSAAPSSNHLDVFKKIFDLKLNTKVNVTLSYKIKKDYQEYIIKKGYEYFGDNFTPQTSFYSKNEFDAMLNNCKIAIFNNERQEGLLTIANCIEKGMKVFLSETSPSYKYLQKAGYNIFSFQNEFNYAIVNETNDDIKANIDNDSIFFFDERKAIRDALHKMEKL